MARAFVRLAAVCCCVAVCMTSATQAQVTLNPAEMRELAGQAVVQGRPDLAFDLSGALIERDPTDLNAQLIRSRAARDLGLNSDALLHAGEAWALADNPDEKYAAALATAQAYSSSGRRTTAQLWLRRAVQLAPNDALRQQAAQDFLYVRRQNPWATALSFSISPNSNINNGSRNETSELFDLPFEFELEGEARALSGVEIATGFSTRYRLISSDLKRTDLQFGAWHRNYVLSDEAKDIAPDAKGSDFATTSVFAGLYETYLLPDIRSQIGWNVRLGKTWYSGEELLRYAWLGGTYQRAFGQNALVSATLHNERQDGLNGRDDASIWTARIAYSRFLESGDRLSVFARLSEADSDADYLDYTQQNVGLRYALAEPIGPAQLEFGLRFGDKDHSRSDYSGDGRQERSLEATITAAFLDLDYYGFIPTVTMRFERTEANLDIYETESLGIQLGVRSAF